MKEADKIKELQAEHARLIAEAWEKDIEVPSDLKDDFTSLEEGNAICKSLTKWIEMKSKNQSEVAVEAEPAHDDEVPAPVAKAKKPRAKKAKVTEAAAPVAAVTEEKTEMAKPAKKAKAKKVVAKKTPAKKAVAKKAKTNGAGPKKGSKGEKIVALLKKGCTNAQMLKALEWPAVSMQQQARNYGLKLSVDRSKRPFVYKAA